ncbi:hypothetical protein JIM95_007945 [Corynebacterium sp. CCM 8835]|uniref:Uncharacterized protein n=1 Tax=Corynebacterium antarcticum TaxID=2800405 RepID=A0ABS1FMI4_9CORY|nr:hypothetical protein [Corynebacterium antarcticum]MCL0246069.1 hypothetical protein [Corynebacterium antarcticum]
MTGLLWHTVGDRRIKERPAELLVLPDAVDTVRLTDLLTVDQINRPIRVCRVEIRYEVPEHKAHPWEVVPHPMLARIVGVIVGASLHSSEVAVLRRRDMPPEKLSFEVTVQASRDSKGVKSPESTQGGVRRRWVWIWCCYYASNGRRAWKARRERSSAHDAGLGLIPAGW